MIRGEDADHRIAATRHGRVARQGDRGRGAAADRLQDQSFRRDADLRQLLADQEPVVVIGNNDRRGAAFNCGSVFT